MTSNNSAALLLLRQARLPKCDRLLSRSILRNLSIGFLSSGTYAFLPALVCTFRKQYPGVKLSLQKLSPLHQEVAFDKGEIDIGFTRTLTAEKSRTFLSRCLCRDPLMAVLPRSRQVKTKHVRVSDLEKDDFILFHREGAPPLFDTITRPCNEAGFSPRVENQPTMMQTVLSLVEAEQGVSIVPACVRSLRSDGVRFYRLQPDKVRVELVAAWKKETPSAALHAFLELVNENAPMIRKKAEIG